MERLEPDDTGLAQIFGAVERPRGLESFAKVLLILLQARRREEVLAVERVFQPEEVKDSRQKVTPVDVGEVTDEGHVRPEAILRDDVGETQVVDNEQTT